MKRTLLIVMLVFALVVDLSGLSRAHAQTGGEYDLMRYTISAGGGTSAANGYTLVGTAGQVDAGVAMTGGGFTLVGGFWGGGASQYKVYLPVLIK
jgi:hypothetical protein